MRETLVKPLYVDNIDLPSNKAIRISSTTDPTGTKDLTFERASSATAKLTDGVGGLAKWNATSGGTGLTGFAVGDLLYADTTTTLARLAVGANGTFLKLAAGVPTWAAAASTALAAVLAVGNTTGGTSLVVSSGDSITGADSTTGGAFPDRAGNGSAGAGGLRSVSGGNGVGTNQNAGGFTASSGNSSGNGTAGVGIFTAPVGSSGSGTNTAVRQWHFSSTSTAANLTAVSTGHLGWASSTDPTASPVVGLTYAASSVLKVTNGTTGWGGMIASGVALGSAVTSAQAAAEGQVRCYNGSNVLQSFMSTGIGLASANLIYWTASDASASGDTAQGRVSAGVWGLTNGSNSNYYFVCGNATGARVRSGDQFSFSSSSTIASSAADAGLARGAAGFVKVTNGSTGRGRIQAIDQTCNGFRLTLETAVPVSTTDQASKTTIYLTPYLHSRISLRDASDWTVYDSAEVSLALGTITSGKNYDVFAYISGTTVTLEMLAWTSDTARATALVRQDGVWCKTGDLTRRYVGSFRTTSTTTTEDSNAKRFVWNMDNRVPRSSTQADAASSWAVAAGLTPVNGGDGDWKHELLVGLNEDQVWCASTMYVDGGTGIFQTTVGLDSTTTQATDANMGRAPNNIGVGMTATGVFSGLVGLGYHYLQGLEDRSTTCTGRGQHSKFQTVSRR